MELDPLLCRCCLKPSATMKNMLVEFLEIHTVLGEVQILHIKTCFTNVCPEISDLSEKSSFICTICAERLKQAYEFRQECLKADTTFTVRDEPTITLVPKIEVDIKEEDEEAHLDETSQFPSVFVKDLGVEKKKEARRRKHLSKKSAKKARIDDNDDDMTQDHKEHLNDDQSEATFVCYYCDDLLASHEDFLQHREMHRTPGEWAIKRSCNLCAVEIKDYIKHLQETHAEYKPNVCHLCNKAFVVQRELKNHLLVHSDSKNFKCQSCSMAFKSLKTLQSHILSKPNHLYYCIFCGGAETKINSILQHVQEKHPENRNKLMLPCYKCKKIFLTFPTLDSHKCPDLKAEPAPGSAHVCSECSDRFGHADQLECHRMVCANRRNGSLHICHVCQKEFPNHRKLIKHKSSSHRLKSFQCDKCGYATKSQSTLNVHVLKHADFPRFLCDFPGCTSRFKHPKGLRFHRDTHQTEASFECFLCEKRFQSLMLIREHMHQHRIRSESYRCDICSKVFKTKYNLAGHHQAQHLGKRFTCDQCANVYANRSGLYVHKKNAHSHQRYQCRHCEQWFGQERSLFEHLFSHRGDKPWNCPICRQGYLRKDKLFQCLECRKEFDCKRKLMRHKSSVHRDNSYCCDQCGYQTKTKSSLQIHALTHSDDRPFHCDHPGCAGRFKNKVHLSAHKRIHGERLFECYICQKRCKTYVHIKRHMAQHCDKLKKHQCEICAKVYTEKYLLEVHVAGHIGKRMFACDQCPNTYMRRNALNMHRRSVHLKLGYECKFCDRWFAQDKSLVEHLFSHRGYKPWNCPVCRQGYVRRDKFKAHLRTHNIEYNEEVHGFKESSRSVLLSGLKVPQAEVEAPSTHFCHICQREFETARKLTKHKSNVHTRNSHQCDICGAQAATRNGLRMHKLIHTDDRPFVCDHPGCTSAFKTKNNLVKHKTSHNERNYECHHCAKRFPTYIYIRSHMATHCDELKMHRCTICPNAFTTKYQLDYHLASHREQRLFECQLCTDVAYARRSSLRLHIKAVHDRIGYVCKFCDHWFAQSHQLIDHIFSHRGYKPYNCTMCSHGYVRKNKFKAHLRTHNIAYDEEIHGFKESPKSILMSGLKASKAEGDRFESF